MQKNAKGKTRNRIVYIVAALITLLLLIALWIQRRQGGQSEFTYDKAGDRTEGQAGPSGKEQEAAAEQPKASFDSVNQTLKPVRKASRHTLIQETQTRDSAATGAVRADSTHNDTTVVTNRCAGDTISPWAYPDPSGGLHHGPVTVHFGSTKPCRIDWRFENGPTWTLYDSASPVRIDHSRSIEFRAVDSCGNRMEARKAVYDIDTTRANAGKCPGVMEFVKAGGTAFCIDIYEWPDRKGGMPIPYVSYYNAVDSCYAAGKRLCTTGEWETACSGPQGWKYPYGQEYEPNACVTHDTVAFPSGSKPECRSYSGVFDMSGNLAEWTSTASSKNKDFYNVMGGFWESGPNSGCFEARYSYFPQNRHNPVGFRCCRDTIATAAGKSIRDGSERTR